MYLVQTAFWEGDLEEDSTWQAVVLIPKGKGDYRGIRLVEVMWRVSACRDPRYGTVYRRWMGKAVQASLAADRRREAGVEVEALVKADVPRIQQVWYRLQGWYKAAVDRAPPPARATLKRVTAERIAIYNRVPPPQETTSQSQ